jgi:hypothetical protein
MHASELQIPEQKSQALSRFEGAKSFAQEQDACVTGEQQPGA